MTEFAYYPDKSVEKPEEQKRFEKFYGKARNMANLVVNSLRVGKATAGYLVNEGVYKSAEGNGKLDTESIMDMNAKGVAACGAVTLNGLMFVMKDSIYPTGLPESQKSGYVDEKLTELISAMPMLMACNDYCDIAIPLKHHSGKYPSQRLFGARLELRNRLRERLGGYRQDFLDKYPEKSGLIENFVNDSRVLSESRPYVKEKVKEVKSYLELDSAIYEAVCIELVRPGLLQSLGLDMETSASSYDDLKKKYELFLNTDYNPGGNNPNLQRESDQIRGLHGVEMLLKIVDDANDRNKGIQSADGILQPPNYVDYLAAQDNPEAELEVVKKEYEEMAEKAGISRAVVGVSEFLLTNLKLANRVGKDVDFQPKDPDQIGKLFNGRKFLIHMREKLAETGVLNELFSSSPITR